MPDDIEAKLDILSNDKEFLASLLKCDTIDEAKVLFDERGIKASDEDLLLVKKIFMSSMDKDGKISDSELEGISGGSAKNWHKIAVGLMAIAVTGTVIGVGIKVSRTMDNMERTRKQLESDVDRLKGDAGETLCGAKLLMQQASGTLQNANNFMDDLREGPAGWFMKKKKKNK